MWTASWVIKCSKLCDLRCSYCYEWEHLADSARIALAEWPKILRAIARYHEIQTARFGEPGRSHLHWHGGEPLLLPLSYVEAILELERDVFGEAALRDRTFRNFIQTNLVSLTPAKLDVLSRADFTIGLSFDVVPGCRVNVAGRDVRDRVRDNLRSLEERGLPVVGAVVLARHTLERLGEIYSFYRSRGIPFTIFPLAESPRGDARAEFTVTEGGILAALEALFGRVIEDRESVAIEPLQSCLETALLHLAGLERPPYDRRAWGDRVLIVETDGTLHTISDRNISDRGVGNVFNEPIDAILDSVAYAGSLDRDDLRRNRHCMGCEFRGACDSYPLFHEPYRDHGTRCRTAHALTAHIAKLVREAGFTESAIREAALRQSAYGAFELA